MRHGEVTLIPICFLGQLHWLSIFRSSFFKIFPAVFLGRLGRWCQSNANRSPNLPAMLASCRELTPLGQRGGAVLLECLAAIEMTVVVEMVVDRGMGGSEFLQGLDIPEAGHRPFGAVSPLRTSLQKPGRQSHQAAS